MPRGSTWLPPARTAAFYVLLLGMPVTGWLMSSATNYPVSWFGLFQLPDLVRPDEALKDLCTTFTRSSR